MYVCVMLKNMWISINSMEKPRPSDALVKDTCMSACKMMKMVSKQLMVMSASYDRIPFEKSSSPIYDTLGVIMSSIGAIQESLIKTGSIMKIELNEELSGENFPDEIVITTKEYKLLNAVFLEYMTAQSTSEEYSLFSSASVYTHKDNNGGSTSEYRRPIEETS